MLSKLLISHTLAANLLRPCRIETGSQAHSSTCVHAARRRQRHTPVAGPPEQDAAAPEAREGILWETYRKFVVDGWRVDAANYSTAFRISLKVGYDALTMAPAPDLRPDCGCVHATGCYDSHISQVLDHGQCALVDVDPIQASLHAPAQGGQTAEDLEAALAQLPELLTYSFNLGALPVHCPVCACQADVTKSGSTHSLLLGFPPTCQLTTSLPPVFDRFLSRTYCSKCAPALATN